MRRIGVWRNKINFVQIINLSMHFLSRWRFVHMGLPVLDFSDAYFREEPWRSDPINQVRVHRPSSNPASKEMISDSVELCETEVCFLHTQLIETNVWLPKIHNVPPEVDFESSRSPAKSESWNSPNMHCLAVFPTWQYWLYSLVWLM